MKRVTYLLCIVPAALILMLRPTLADTLTVTNMADSGPGTLRQSIADATPGDTIIFGVTGTITLVSQLLLNKSMTIAGPGTTNLVIFGYGTRVFNVSSGPTVVSGLTLSNGVDWFESPPGGGAIYNTADLTLLACDLGECESFIAGGAVYNSGGAASLTALGCTFSENRVTGFYGSGGGAIYSDHVMRVTNCTFSGNYSAVYGGAVYSSGDTVIASSTLAHNGADVGGGGIFNGGRTLNLQNSLLAANRYFYGFYPQDIAGGVTSGDYNLILTTNGLVLPGTHNVLGQDPIVSPLRYLGGPTRVFGLAYNSPALDSADPATSPAIDQRGSTRPQGIGFDIGAFEGALPTNHPPIVAHLILDQSSSYQAPFNFLIPTDTFSDPDADQTLFYSVSGLPYGLSLDPLTGIISGTIWTAGTIPITVFATDNGAPMLSASTSFNIVIPKVPITAKADDTSRVIGDFNPSFTITYFGMAPGDGPGVIDSPPMATTTADFSSPPGSYPITLSGGSDDVYDIVGLTNGTLTVTLHPLRAEAANACRGVGQPNQPFFGILTGVVYPDNITATYISAATPSSPPGDYAITPILDDPDGRLTNYDVTLVNGTLTVEADATYPDFQTVHSFGFTNQIGGTAGELLEGLDGWLYGSLGQFDFPGLGVFKVRKDGTGFLVIRTFSPEEGYNLGALLQEADGTLYGMSSSAVWRMQPDGTGFTVLHAFGSIPDDGTSGAGTLLKGSDGALYGTTRRGGTNGYGSVFRLGEDGSGYNVIHSFGAPYADGADPSALIEGQDGYLYGTTLSGGSYTYDWNGAVFRVSKDGLTFNVLHRFANGAADGAYPKSRLLEAAGRLYGTTASGGPSFGGTVFSISEDGIDYSVLKFFDYYGSDGRIPYAPLIRGDDGLLYGTTTEGGPTSYGGTVFRIATNGSSFEVLKQFADTPNDIYIPRFGLTKASDGFMYGTAVRGGDVLFNDFDGGVFKIDPTSSAYSLLYPFSRFGGDGAGSITRASEGSDGMIYGTTTYGGRIDGGTVFRMNKDGTAYAVLHSFTGGTNDGLYPRAEVVEGTDGLLYGTTSQGGASGFGTAFKIAKDGSGFGLLHSFADGPNDGSSPMGGFLVGPDGKLYGTTYSGGSAYGGTVFSLGTNGIDYAILKEFDWSSNGFPQCTIIQDTNGYLIGTLSGGYSDTGAIFKIGTNGLDFSVLHKFDSLAGSSQPVGGLLLASDGFLYGLASDQYYYGTARGAVFKLRPTGTDFEQIHKFGLSASDGRIPYGPLVEGADGRLYGTTQFGGVFDSHAGNGAGTLFRLKKDGSGYFVLQHFDNPGRSLAPSNGKGSLVRTSDGSLYALTADGGDLGFGTVYRLTFTSNTRPVVQNLIPDHTNGYGAPLTYAFPENTFSDPDVGQVLSYNATGLPPGLTFDGPTRTFLGTPTNAGLYSVTVTATDDGAPPMSTNTSFVVEVARAELTVGADNKSRPYGQANPPLTGSLSGVTNGDSITVSFATTATPASPLGSYPIIPVFSDPDNRLPDYSIITNNGTMDVTCASNLVVTTTADVGFGSLRQAILDANDMTCASNVLISFNIPGPGVHTIAPTSALPAITRSVIIDGYTQPSASPNTLGNADNALLLVEVSGANITNDYGLRLDANGCTVRGLVINRFVAQVLLENATNDVVEGNFLGPDATGTNVLGSANGVLIVGGAGHRVGGLVLASRNVIAGNWYVGLNVGACLGLQALGNFVGVGADGVTAVPNGWGINLGTCSLSHIGGSTASARNVIGANTYGCWITGGSSNVIQGNFIGTDTSGTLRRTNVYGLVLQQTPGNLVGGTALGEGNLLSGNQTAVYFDGEAASNNVIAGNFIGPDVTGTNLLGNNYYGVTIEGGPNNTIGGTAPGARNVICGNDYAGVALSSPTSKGNIIQGNYIGVDVTGTNALPSVGYGVVVYDASETLIGGASAGARNVIARNLHGIAISTGSNNLIQGNFIGTDAAGKTGLGNSGHGIVLGNAPGTVIGGTTPGAGNVIATNGYDGISIDSPGTIVQGNFIGTDVTGTNALFNGWAGIELGSEAHDCLIGGTNTAARNVITGNGGIGLYSSNNVIQGNYLGVGPDGITVVGNPSFGISVIGEGNLIGGDGAGEGNLVSGWFAAIRIAGSNNVVQGNLMGTDSTGTSARSIQNYALTIWGRNNLIGGLTSGSRNLISASAIGVVVTGDTATGNSILGNYIGTDITGTNALGNYQGIDIEYAPGNLVGGTNSAARNVISGNGGYGLGIAYDGASNNVVQGNYFGLAADGITPLPNYAGVRIISQSGNLIGGAAPGAGNWIAYHATYGVSLIGDGATNNAILGNHIFANGWWGIDLGEDGASPNDPGDVDGSPNHLQNWPEITSASLNGGQVSVHYRVDSASANSAYPLTVEFFLADTAGQGKALIYRDTYSTPQLFTDIVFTPAVTVVGGDSIVATATDANGNTSEFSAATPVISNHAPIVANPLPDRTNISGNAFNYTFPTNTFSDPDAGQALGYTASGLPPGITFNGPTRTFGGTNASAGTFVVTITATDNGSPPLSTNDVFNFVVLDCSALAITNRTLPSVVEGTAYNVTLRAINGTPPYTFTVAGGALPGNVALAPGGALTGTPTNSGNFPVTITASSSEGCAVSSNYVLSVTCPAISVQPTFLFGATRYFPYSQTFTASGGIAPRTFAVTSGSLPPGFTLSSAGVLSGTATNTGSYPFTVTATDAGGCTGSRNYTLGISCSAVLIAPASLPGANVGQVYAQTLTATNGREPYNFHVVSGDLPVGLTLSSAGVLSGTLTSAANYTFTLGASDADFCSGSVSYSVVVTNNPFKTTGSLADGRAGQTATLLPNGQVLVVGGTGPYGALDTTELYDPARGTWTNSSSLHVARFNHTATLLGNGKVLVAGGDFTGTCEIYEPATKSWTFTGNLGAARRAHTATLLTNGKVLATGGSDGGTLSSSELYDPIKGTWSASGTMTDARWYHTSTLLTSGKVLAVGGQGNGGFLAISSAELYDPVSGAWTPTGGLGTERAYHRTLLLPNGKALAVGGWRYNASGIELDSCEVYDPTAGSWTSTGALAFPRMNFAAALLPNGRVMVAGGSRTNNQLVSAEMYDSTNGTWSAAGALLVPSEGMTATVLADGQVLFEGGYNSSSTFLVAAELYDSAFGSWSNSGSLSSARDAHTLTLLPNGKALAVGGYGSGGPLTNAESYDPALGNWQQAGSNTIARAGHTAALLPNGRVLVMGGANNSGILSNAQLFVTASSTWTNTGSMSGARANHTATLLANGKVLAAGGENDGTPLSTVELYDPATGQWSGAAPLFAARRNHTATLLRNGKVLVAGGAGSSATLLSAELYDPASGLWTATGNLSTNRGSHTATLLPNGLVLVAGGNDNSGNLLSSAELYDPITGTWTVTGGMTTRRGNAAAILLPNGKVLVAGGLNFNPSFNYVSTCDIYDPATGTWQQTASLALGRSQSAATLLPNGKVLLAGGYTGSYLSSAELYDIGLGFNSSWQPQIATATSPLNLNTSLALTGSRFRGVSEASGGDIATSPADHPVVQLRSLESGQIAMLQAQSWTSNSFTSMAVTGLPPGYSLATVFVNGIPSPSVILAIAPAPSATPFLLLRPARLLSGAFQFSFTNTAGVQFTALVSTNPALAFSNWTTLGAVAEGPAGQFQFTDPQATTNQQRFYRVRSP